jgi:uncharacterized protein
MADYYADSSVLVKRHVPELGSGWFVDLARPTAGATIFTSILSQVEVISALTRRVREGSVAAAEYSALADDFRRLCVGQYVTVELEPTLVSDAQMLLERYPLRAYDALHLATALATNVSLRLRALPELTFLCADSALRRAAEAEGLATDDPNAPP